MAFVEANTATKTVVNTKSLFIFKEQILLLRPKDNPSLKVSVFFVSLTKMRVQGYVCWCAVGVGSGGWSTRRMMLCVNGGGITMVNNGTIGQALLFSFSSLPRATWSFLIWFQLGFLVLPLFFSFRFGGAAVVFLLFFMI